MILNSGTTYRSIPSNKEFSFSSTIVLNNTSGNSILGFSGANNILNFLNFTSGKILDFNNRHIWSYNPSESVFISGNIGDNFINYFINNIPICLHCPRETGYYNNFYASTNNTILNFDFFIQSEEPSFIFNFPSNVNFGTNVTGNIVNINEDNLKSFRIFTGFLNISDIDYLISELPNNEIFGGQTGSVKLNFNDTFSLQGLSGTSLILNLNTNFGIIQRQIDLIYNQVPLYFIDFITGFTGVTGLNLEQGIFYNYELQTISPEDQNFTLSLTNYSGHTGEEIFQNFDIIGDISGVISGFIQGADFITGNIKGTGISADLEVDFFDNLISGTITSFEKVFAVATGEINYNYNLLFAGGSGFGPAPLNTRITGFGNLLSKENINSFVFRNRTLTGIGTGNLTGLWGIIFQSSTGEGIIQENKFFTGDTLIDFKDLTTTTNKFNLGPSWFRNYIIHGITGNTGINYVTEDSGIKNLNTNILIPQLTGSFLENIIPFQNFTMFNTSGTVRASSNVFSANNLFYPNSSFWSTNSLVSTGYIDFEFSKFQEKDKLPVTHYEINLDINSNFYPYIFSIKGLNNINDTPILLDIRTGENFYSATSRIFELKQSGKFNILRFEINSGILWPHQNNLNFAQGLKINKLNYFSGEKFSGFFDSLSPFLLNNKSIDLTASGGNIFISYNTGNNWSAKEDSRPWLDIDITYDGKIQSAVTSGGYIYVSYDSGENWEQKAFTGNWRKISISKLDGQYQFAVTNTSGFFSLDTGNNWNVLQNLSIPSNSNLTDNAISENGQYLAATAYNGKPFVSANFGVNWINGDSPTANWKDIGMSKDGQTLTAVIFSGGQFDSNAGRIFRSINAGQNWIRVTTAPVNQRRNWIAVDMSNNGQYQTAVEQTGNIFRSINFGQNWSQINLTRDWRDIAISYSGNYQILTADNDNIYISQDFGENWVTRESERPWRGASISKNGYIQSVVAKPPYIEIFSSNTATFRTDDYKAFNTGSFATISGVSSNIFLTYKSANPLNKNYEYFYIEFEQGYLPSRLLLQKSKNGVNFSNIFEKRNLNRIETGEALLDIDNQYFKWVFSQDLECDNSGDSIDSLNPVEINLNSIQTKICGSISGNLANYYTINNFSDSFIANIGFIAYDSDASTIFNLQTGFYFSNSVDTGQYIVSGLVDNNFLFSNLLTSLSKKDSSVLGSGVYNIQIKPTGNEIINYELVIFSVDIGQCSVLVENAGFDFKGDSLNGLYAISNRHTLDGKWNDRPYYENLGKDKSFWWNGNRWVLGGGKFDDVNPDSYSYLYASGSGNFPAPYFVLEWGGLIGRPNPNVYRACF